MPTSLLRVLLFVGGILCVGTGGVPATADEPATKDPGPSQTPFLRSIEDLLEDAEFDDDDVDVDELRTMLREADVILRRVKEENRRALRNVNRQVPTFAPGYPNILLVLADDLDPQFVSGEPSAEGLSLPAFERLRAEGLRFTDFHAASPLDLDAFRAILSGRLNSPATTPHRGQFQTLPSVLWHAGYSTGFFGAWPLDGPLGPLDCDCDVFIGFRGSDACAQAYPREILVNDIATRLDGDQGPFAWSQTTMQALAAIERETEGRPLFQIIRYHALEAPPKEVSDVDFPEGLNREERGRAAQSVLLDRELGRILAHLDRKGLTERTLILVVGETSGSYRAESPERDLVRSASLRVPAFARWPNRVPAGAESDRLGGNWDLLPTLGAVVRDQRFSQRNGGLSLTQSLFGFREPPIPSRLIYWRIPADEDRVWQAVRLDHWKAIVAPGSSHVELYDLRTDPHEETDVSGDHPEVVSKMLHR